MDKPASRQRYALAEEQVAFYHQHGYLHLPAVFDADAVAAMAEDLDWLMDAWASKGPGWSGPWRRVYMSADVEKRSQLIALHDLHRYSKAWCDAVVHPSITGAVADLIGANVELHHTTLHAKPPESGHPFPMHQDWAFYKHENGRYVDCLIHLDDTDDRNGCIRFLDASHKGGAREHVVRGADGSPCTPHLPTDAWSLEDTVPVPARRGDVVAFSIHTIHGSRINTTNRLRRIVRAGYRDPANAQTAGQSIGRPGLIVRGRRPRAPRQAALPTTI